MEKCVCGRTFAEFSALTNHQRRCASMKKRLSTALTSARQTRNGLKRRRLDLDGNFTSLGDSSTITVEHQNTGPKVGLVDKQSAEEVCLTICNENACINMQLTASCNTNGDS